MIDEQHIAWPGPFKDPTGRVWHARHQSAEDRFHHAASSLCGTNLASCVDRLEGPFPPTNAQYRPCSKCLFLSSPETMSIPAFVLLQKLVAGARVMDAKRQSRREAQRHLRAIGQLIERDLIEVVDTNYRPTRLGWLNIRALRKHPAFDSELFKLVDLS